MFKKILIANRGEIPCRVILTTRKLGLKTVAVYSDAAKDARHVDLADEAVNIGPAPRRDSYLQAETIIAACKQSGAEVLHPGYAFLSEHPWFSKRVEEVGIVFIGRKHYSIHPDWVFSRIFGDSSEKITQEERRLFYVALTRAIDTLVIFTEGRGKSPFLDDIEKQIRLQPLDWAAFPSVTSISGNRLVVQVKNRLGVPSSLGNFAVKNQLDANRYRYHGLKKLWEKSFPAENFNFDIVRNEVWATATSQVDVSVVNNSEVELASYHLDVGAWTCLFDNLDVAKETSLDVPLEVVK